MNRILGVNPRTQLRDADEKFANDAVDDAVFCIAYRAASFDYTENNLGAIRQCSRNGCKFIHLDVKVTADNIPVISRNTTVLLKQDSVSLKKTIEESLSVEIEENSIVDEAGEYCQPEIPTLESAILLCKILDMKIMINVVHSFYYSSLDEVVNVFLQLYEKYPDLSDSSILSSDNPILLYKIRKRNNKIIIALQWTSFSETPTTSISWLKSPFYKNKVEHCILKLVDSCALWLLNNFIYRVVGLTAVILPKHLITSEVVEYWESKNIRCIASIVNLYVEKLYYKKALGIAYLTDTVDIN